MNATANTPTAPAAWGHTGLPLPVVSEIESEILSLEGIPQADGIHGRCLYIAHATASVLHRHGRRVCIQAGSMQWPRMRREEDDIIGSRHTHFAYMWEPRSQKSRQALFEGHMPEMHVWVALLDSQEVVDFSTRDFRTLAEAAGLAWTADAPPRYLCAGEHNWPDWVRYEPYREATLVACRILQELFQPNYLRS